MRWLVLSALLLAATPAVAAPHSAKAKADFQRGVKAYTNKDYAAASDAFEKSFDAEADVETLFAWAQAERQQDHCEEAIKLYKKMDDFTLPAKNREFVVAKRDECQAIIDAAKPHPKPDPRPDPGPKHPKPVPDEPTPDTEPDRPEHPDRDRPERPAHASPHFWDDTTGDALALGGVAGLGVGIVFLVGSYNAAADADKANMMNRDAFNAANDRAKLYGSLGVGITAVGAITLGIGLLHYARFDEKHTADVTVWTTHAGGGLAIAGAF